MSHVEALLDELCASLQQPKKVAGLEAFHVTCDEVRTLAAFAVTTEQLSCQLTLVWQDGSISSVQFTLPAPFTSGSFPWDLWKQMRYFQPMVREFAKINQPLPKVSLFDPAIAAMVKEGEIPKISEFFDVKLSVTKRTVAHSQGLLLQDECTAVAITSLVEHAPIEYVSRRLPTVKEKDYLLMELAWYDEMRPLKGTLLDVFGHDTQVLLSPGALRSILHCGWIDPLLPHYDTANHALQLPLWTSSQLQSPLAIRYDPLVPWAIGSYRLITTGGQAQQRELHCPDKEEGTSGSILAADYQPQSLHWQSPKTEGFRRWLPKQPNVLFIPNFSLPQVVSKDERVHTVVPTAYAFQNGRLKSYGSFAWTFCPSSLISSLQPVTIRKTGWDSTGAIASFWQQPVLTPKYS